MSSRAAPPLLAGRAVAPLAQLSARAHHAGDGHAHVALDGDLDLLAAVVVEDEQGVVTRHGMAPFGSLMDPLRMSRSGAAHVPRTCRCGRGTRSSVYERDPGQEVVMTPA